MKKIQLFKNYDELFNQVERYLLDKRNDGNTELNKFSLVLQLIRNSGGGTTQDIINQLIESNSYLEVETTADRLNLIFGDTVNDVIIEKGVVVRDNTGLYTLIDTITSSPNSWVNISETSLDAFLELLIEQPSPIINVRNLGLAEDNVWIGDNLNKPVPNPVGYTLIGTASLVAGTITIENSLITAESIVTLSPSTTGILTGTLRYTVSAGQVVVESRDASNVLINTDTVTFGFNIETGANDTLRKSIYILVNDPVAIAERNLVFSGAQQQFLRTATAFPQFSKTQPFTIMVNCNVGTNGAIFYSADNITSSIYRGIRIIMLNGILDFQLSVNGTVGDIIGISANTTANGIFHFTYDGSNTTAGMNIYKNNVLIASSVSTKGLVGDIAGNNIIYVNRRNAFNGSFNSGTIKNIGIVDYAQNNTERAADVVSGVQTASSGTSLFNLDLTYPTQIKTLNTTDINAPLPNANALVTTDSNAYKMNLFNFPAQLVIGTNLV